MRSRTKNHWVLLTAAVFPLAGLAPFLLLRGPFAKLIHLFIPLWMVAVRAYWSARKKREAVKSAKGQPPAALLRRYDLLDQLSLIFLFFFEYALLLGLTVYARSAHHERPLVAAVFLLMCVVLYFPHVALRVKAYGNLERYVDFNEPGRGELGGLTYIDRVNVNHSMR